MSANRWTVCPRCLKRAQRAFQEKVAEVQASYGKVSLDEFQAAFNALRTPAREDFNTFREDYSISNDGSGTVQIEYSGTCTECRLCLSIDEVRKIPNVDE